MRFFEPGPGVDDEMKARIAAMRARQVPPNELGVHVDVHPVVLRSPDAVVRLESVRVFSTGVELSFELRKRAVAPWFGDGVPGSDGLFVGVESSDGRTATSIGNPWLRPDDAVDPNELMVRLGSGHSGGIEAGWTYFVSPVPPPGPVTLVVAAPDLDLGEGTVTLDGDDLQRALSQVQALWDWPEELNPADQQRPRRPEVAPGGWFDRHMPGQPGSAQDFGG